MSKSEREEVKSSEKPDWSDIPILPSQKTSRVGLIDAKRKVVEFHQNRKPLPALQWCRFVLDQQADDATMLTVGGALAIDLKKYNLAIWLLEKSIAIESDNEQAHYLLGCAYNALNQPADAREVLKNGLVSAPTGKTLLLALANTYLRTNQPDLAEETYRLILKLNPNNTDAMINLGSLMKTMGEKDDLLEMCHRSIDAEPTRAEPYLTLANYHRERNDFELAVKYYESFIERANEIHAAVYRNYGVSLQKLQRLDEAEKNLNKAFEMDNDLTVTGVALANFYFFAKKNKEAKNLFKKILKKYPNDLKIRNDYYFFLYNIGLYSEARKVQEHSIALDGGAAANFNNLAILLMEMNLPSEAIEAGHRCIELDPDYIDGRSSYLFYSNYVTDFTPEFSYAEHKKWGERYEPSRIARAQPHGNSRDPERRLKIGYVSPDFYGHAVSYFIENALKHHDRKHFEVYAYANVLNEDGVSVRLKAHCDHWINCKKMSDEELVEQIRRDEIDILVDLAGHTFGNRLLAFAYKPAPVQATWIGYPNTTGMSQIDYRIVDDVTDPFGEADKFHTETLERLETGFSCYHPNANMPAPSPLPLASNGYVTFASFNNLAKVQPSVVDLWSMVMNEIPNSRILIKAGAMSDHETRKLYRERFARNGITDDHITLMGKVSSYESHVDLYDIVDIALDSSPFNGATTSCEALWHGVPVVTLPIDRHVGRVTASFLTQLGITELIARDKEDFVRILKNLVADVPKLSDLRRTLRRRMSESILTDGVRSTRDIEDAYRKWWRKWCEEPS